MNLLKKLINKDMLYMRNTILPHQYGWTGFLVGYIVAKRKTELTRFQRKKLNFIT